MKASKHCSECIVVEWPPFGNCNTSKLGHKSLFSGQGSLPLVTLDLTWIPYYGKPFYTNNYTESKFNMNSIINIVHLDDCETNKCCLCIVTENNIQNNTKQTNNLGLVTQQIYKYGCFNVKCGIL